MDGWIDPWINNTHWMDLLLDGWMNTQMQIHWETKNIQLLTSVSNKGIKSNLSMYYKKRHHSNHSICERQKWSYSVEQSKNRWYISRFHGSKARGFSLLRTQKEFALHSMFTLTSGNRNNLNILCSVIRRWSDENWTSTSFFGFKLRCQYL